MANVDAFESGFGQGKKASQKTKKTGGFSADRADPANYKKGGKVKKTGMALVHKGETVLTKAQTKKHSGKRKRVASKR